VITPGVQAPTVAPLTDSDWVAVRVMVKRNNANDAMDRLAKLGCKAILTTEIRSCRVIENGDAMAEDDAGLI
jgi:ATP phosphoribosyltransferase